MTFFTKICIVFLCNFLIINSGLYTLSLNSYYFYIMFQYELFFIANDSHVVYNIIKQY
ncbi:hypothetical protein EJ73_02870 [Hoylesella shahii DSM 15611 = JCM 12083]|uniref:Uncharacterized protein n=1 Tax=Hoylesella shahii DSM 15611 = JCM 12083 TaxID=1122991 RepID=A0A318HPR2_9BACT|nr:hypothetical protein EJ73_02870 [Hoylesella shahii DSM 15611 = JCM 12083]